MTDRFSEGQIVTVFRSRLRDDADPRYEALDEALRERARSLGGMVDVKSFVADDGERVTLIGESLDLPADRVIDATGKSAVVYAASRGFDDIVHRLLDAGVDPRNRYANDLTALMWVAGHDEGVGASAVERVVAAVRE